MRALLLSLLIVAAAAGADLKPIASLPWCRVTLNMAATPATDAPVYKTVDGWYDEETRLLIAKDDVDGTGLDYPAPFDPAQVVKVEKAPRSPALPANGLQLANKVRSEHVKAGDAKKPQTKP